jgi:hypothetical protein
MGRARLMRGSAALGLAALVLTGCASAQEPEVTRVATAFENPSGNPEARCDLLAPATLKAFEKDQASSCSDAVAQLSMDGGTVTKVEIWGGDAQVRMSGDTVFLTETDAGWRVTAANCTSQGEAPYECEVEGP